MQPTWQWEEQSPSYGNFGNANQWTVNAGLTSLARESAQNTNDARVSTPGELVYSFIRLTGQERADFLSALRWNQELGPHLAAMSEASSGAVAAGQIKAGVRALEESDALVLLKVSDYGCRGLTGPEFPDNDTDPEDFGNFIKLCRLDLFSGKDKAAGGSFGLGKAVYWRFSRLQTVLFNSTVDAGDAVHGQTASRVFGVNQGVLHRVDGKGFQGRGYFGVPEERGYAASTWNDSALVESLHLTRHDDRPGTTALLLGFYDPDRPELGLGSASELLDMAQELRAGVEESFWPMLTRGRMQVRIEVIDAGEVISTEVVDPEATYIELVRALRRFDKGDLDAELGETYSVIAKDIPIKISKRSSGDMHEAFTHVAKLVVTMSDPIKDNLENRVCLFRRPEMVVETIDRTFEGRTYHAFLLAGAAINPDNPTTEQLRADDFLRFAEPPAHDRWIPGTGRGQTSQANLTAHYVAPWLPNLHKVADAVRDALIELFGEPPPAPNKPPESIFKHLRFLRGEPGSGGSGGGALRKPDAELLAWQAVDGAWQVRCQISARNRPEGWEIQPRLAMVGLDGRRTEVEWDKKTTKVVAGSGTFDGDSVLLPAAERGRLVKITFEGSTHRNLPIPAEESAVELVLRRLGPLPKKDTSEAQT